jgi:hypothetical protein
VPFCYGTISVLTGFFLISTKVAALMTAVGLL